MVNKDSEHLNICNSVCQNLWNQAAMISGMELSYVYHEREATNQLLQLHNYKCESYMKEGNEGR